MAVQRRVNWVSQQRVDVPDMRSIESASSNDFDQLLQTLIVSDLPGYVLRGFDLVMTGAIGGAASGLNMNVANAALLHPFASQSGTYFVVPNGTPVQVLNSAINTQVNGAFTPNSENFVGIDYTRSVDDLTDAQVYIWDPTDNDETTSVLPRAIILNFQIVISTSTWATNVLPVCTVTTDAGNNVISIEDNRPLLYRLGTAGTSQPNPYYTYPWTAQPEGRTENPYISTSNAVNPFQGGDKMLFTQKDETDAIKSILKEIKGSAFWYTFGSTSVANVNLSSLFFDTDGSVLTMRGKFIHSQVTPGMLTWTGQLNLQSISGPLEFIVAPGTVTLLDQEVAYIYLVRDQNFQSLNSFTFVNGSTVINASGLVAGIAAGDWIRFFSDSITAYQQVQSVSGSTVTLVNPYIGSSATGIALRSQGTYTMTVAEPDSVPADNNAFWIAKRSDNGTITATIEASPLGAVRSSGITTFTTTLPHGINAGQGIQAQGVTDPTFNQFFEVLTVPTASSVTVENPGLDSSSGGGTLSSTATIYLRGIGEVSQGESSSDDSSALEALLQYTGAPYAGATQPQYGSTIFVTQGIDLTDAISELDSALGAAVDVADQDRNLKLIEGGTWSYNGITGVLSWSADAYVQIPGQDDTLNTIAAGSVTLAADQVAYVVVNRTGTPPLTVAPVVAAITAVPANSNVVIFARRQPTTNSVIVGTHSFALFDGEASTLDGALGVIDDYFSEIRMTAVRPNNTRILISDADVTMLTGETRSQRISSFLLNFAGAQIDFQTGDVYESDGSTPLGIDFTPVIPAAGMWRWFTIVIIPDMLGSDNRMVGDILVLPAAADGASAAAAPRSIFTGSGIALGQVVITSVDGTTVTAIPQANIVQLGVGSGSGSGGGSLIKINLYDGVDTVLPSSSPVTIDNVTVVSGMLVVFTQLVSGNNEVYQASVIGGSSSPNLPNDIILQISNANPYAGGHMESVVNSGNVATSQPANDAYFEIDGMSGTPGTPQETASYSGTSFFTIMGANTYEVDQPFVASTTGGLGTATFRISTYGGSSNVLTGYVNVGVWTDNAGVPGTLVSNLVQIPAASLTYTAVTGDHPGPTTIQFTSGSIVSGTTYHFVVDCTNVVFSMTVSVITLCSTLTPLSEPAQLESTDSGATWTPFQESGHNTNMDFTITTGASLIAQNIQSQNTIGPIVNDVNSNLDVYAQPFTPSSNVTATALLYNIDQELSLTGSYTVGIYNDSGGLPGSPISVQTINLPITESLGSYTFVPGFSAPLISGTQYWILWNFGGVSGLSGSDEIYLGTAGTTATTPPQMLLSTDGGSTYSPLSPAKTATFAVMGGGSSPVVFASNTSINTTEDETANDVSLGQTFTASSTAFLTDAIFMLSTAMASPPNAGNLVVSIYTDNAGQPGTLVETSSPINSASLTTTPTLYTFNFSGSNTLTSGQVYHAILYTGNLTGTTTPGSISWTPQPEFASPYQPATGDMLVVTQGLQFANQVTEFNGTTWVVNPFYRSFNGLDFWESSSIITSTALNNAATSIFSVTALGSENIIVNASVLRSGNKETFTLWLTNNGTIAEVSGGGSDTAPTGVTWSATLMSGIVSLVANCDNSGGDATVKYIVTRWSDGGAGPTGLPSYSPVLPSGVEASAFTMSDGSSTPYNCAAPFNVLGLTNISLDFSYVPGLNSGSTVGALDVYVNGQRISRYVSSAVTPPSAGTLYTEISTTQIQFTTNIMSTPLTVEIIKRS